MWKLITWIIFLNKILHWKEIYLCDMNLIEFLINKLINTFLE